MEPRVGAMLPWNVILREVAGGVEVSAIDPVASMQAVENAELIRVAAQVRDLLGQGCWRDLSGRALQSALDLPVPGRSTLRSEVHASAFTRRRLRKENAMSTVDPHAGHALF